MKAASTLEPISILPRMKPSSTRLANTSAETFTPTQSRVRSRSFKRGMKGVYQHCKEKHLHRYLAEFDFRYNHRIGLGYSDIDRTFAAIKGVEGKRLTYRQPH